MCSDVCLRPTGDPPTCRHLLHLQHITHFWWGSAGSARARCALTGEGCEAPPPPASSWSLACLRCGCTRLTMSPLPLAPTSPSERQTAITGSSDVMACMRRQRAPAQACQRAWKFELRLAHLAAVASAPRAPIASSSSSAASTAAMPGGENMRHCVCAARLLLMSNDLD